LPFSGNTSALVFVALLSHEPRPVWEWNQNIPPQLSKIIHKALHKDRNLRYESADELRRALDTVPTEVRQSAPPPKVEAPAPVPPAAAPMPPRASAPGGPQVASAPVAVPSFSGSLQPNASRSEIPGGSREIPSREYGSASGAGPAYTAAPPTAPPMSVPTHSDPGRVSSPASSSSAAYDLPAAPVISDEVLMPREPYSTIIRQPRSSETISRTAQARAQKAAVEKQKMRMPLTVLGVLLLAAVIGLCIYYEYQNNPSLNSALLQQGDTVTIGSIDNKTDSSLLDHAFRVGLALDLQQSPFINVVLAPDGVNSGGKAVLSGTISGTQPYIIDLKLVPAGGGKPIAVITDTAQDMDHLLETIDRVTLAIRKTTNEKSSTIDEYNRPLHQETTSSVEALEEFAQGETSEASHAPAATAMADYLKALDADKYFTLAAERLALLYAADDKIPEATQYAASAYSGRQTLSERSKMEIEVLHAWLIQNDLASVQSWRQQLHAAYPQDVAVDSAATKPAAPSQP
jgi:hypothetical protein